MIRKQAVTITASTVFVLFTQFGCNTAGQPNWAAQQVAAQNQALAQKSTFRFRPFRKVNSQLGLKMVEVEDDGALLLRSPYGFEKLMVGKQMQIRGHYLILLESDPSEQTAVVESWPKALID